MADSDLMGEHLAATIPKYMRGRVEGFIDGNILLNTLRRKGRISHNGGGSQLEWRVRLSRHEHVAERKAVGVITDRTFQTDAIDEIATLAWTKYESTVAVPQDYIDLNKATPSKIFDYFRSQVSSFADDTFEAFDAECYSDGTTTNQIKGLAAFISATPTSGSYAGINRGTFTQWANQAVVVGDYSSWAADGIEMVRDLSVAIQEDGGRRPDIGILTFTDYGTLLDALYTKTTVNAEANRDSRLWTLGFDNVVIQGIPLVPAQNCTASRVFALNSDKIELVTVPLEGAEQEDDIFATFYDRDRVYTDAIAIVTKAICQLKCDLPLPQGIITTA